MTVEDLKTKNLPEDVDVLVLDGSGRLQTDVGLKELLRYLSADPEALIWCDVYGTQGGQNGPYGGCCEMSSASTTYR